MTQKSAVHGKLPDLKFVDSRACSSTFEFRKEGDAYRVDVFSGAECFRKAGILSGSAPVASVFRPAVGDQLHGYEDVEVSWETLRLRDDIHAELDKLPNVSNGVRDDFNFLGVVTVPYINLRQVTGLAPGDAQLNKDLCLPVDPDALARWKALPAEQRGFGLDPEESDKPYPTTCQFLPGGQWFTLEVPAAAAVAKKDLLDALVAETVQYKEYREQRAGLDVVTTKLIGDVRMKAAEVTAADLRTRRLKLAGHVVKSNCTSTNEYNKRLCGPNKDAYVAIVKSRLVPDLAPLIDAAKASSYAKPQTDAVAAKYMEALAVSDQKTLELARLMKSLQQAMKAARGKVGIATNHIRNLDEKRISLVFKDLPAFPIDGRLAEELARHTFSFDNAWFDMAFPKANAHPLVTNLHNEINDGYAVTFAGYPVAAMTADTDHSGGASVIALPTRKKDAVVQDRGKAEASKGDSRPNRETTTTGGAEGGC